MNKKLYLVDPPRKFILEGFPSALPQMKLWVEREMNDVEVKILDYSSLERDDTIIKENLHRIDLNDNDYFGITATTATYQSSLNLARLVKSINPNVKVLLGGHHTKEAQVPSKPYRSENWRNYITEANVVLENHPEIDFVVLGEGERTLVDLLSGKELKQVRGIAYRDGSDILKTLLPTRLIGRDLDTISIRNFDEESLSKMTQFGNINYISATGCPLECAFCSVGREKVESKSISKKIEDLQYLVERFPGVRKGSRISIQDNFFGKSIRDTIALCEAIIDEEQRNSEFYFNWDCQTRVESMTDKGLTDLMRKAGCVAVYPGVENFSEEVLIYLNKAHNVRNYLQATRQCVSNLLDSGIEVYLQFQTGMPMESEKHRAENIRVLKELGEIATSKNTKVTVFMSLSVVYPGTNHAHQMFESGIPRNAFERYTEWEDAQLGLREYVGKNFGHGSGGIPTGIMDMEAFRKGGILIYPFKITQINDYFARIGNIPGIKCYYQS